MYVISSSNRRTDEPTLNLDSIMNGHHSSDWNNVYDKGNLDIIMTDVVHKSQIVIIRGFVYEHANASLTEVNIGSAKIPIIDARIIGKKGNKTIVDISFLLSYSDVVVINPITWSFKMCLPKGFECNTLLSEKCTIRYISSLVKDPIAVGLEISPVSFTLMWPEGGQSVVLINGNSTVIQSNRIVVTAIPDTSYKCIIETEEGNYSIDIHTPCASIESYRRHYRSCKKQFGNGYIYDLTKTDPFVISELRKYAIILNGDSLILSDQVSGETHTLTAIGNGGTIQKGGSFYIIPSFDSEDEQCVCMDLDSRSHVIKFDRTESFVKYDEVVYTHGERFFIEGKTIDVVKGSIILIVYDSGPGIFPGDAVAATQVLSSGDMVMRDLIMRSSFQVSEKVDGDYTYGKSAFFVYNSISNTTQEATRITHSLDDTETLGGLTIDVLYTPQTGDGYMHRAIEMAPSATTFSSIDSNGTSDATLDVNGLKFNSNNSDVYFGESQDFRIHYEPETASDPSMLQIQGYDSVSGLYITRQMISNAQV